MAGYTVNIQSSDAYFYTNIELSEGEIKKIIPFINASKRIQYLGMNVTKNVKDLYWEN